MKKFSYLFAALLLAACAHPSKPQVADATATPVLVATSSGQPAAAPLAAPAPTVLPKKTVKMLDKFVVDESRRVDLIDTELGFGFVKNVDDDMANTAIAKMNEYEKKDPHKPIHIIIKTTGGQVLAGTRIIQTMEALEAPTVCVVDGYAYSMGAMMLEFCDSRYVQKYARVMFHEAKYGSQGTSRDITKDVRETEAYLDTIQEDIAARLGLSLAEYRAKIAGNDWYMTAAEAVDAKAADAVVKGLRYEVEAPKAEEALEFPFPFPF